MQAQTYSLVEGSSTSTTSFEVEVHIDVSVDLQALSLTVCLEDPSLSQVAEVAVGSDLQSMNGGSGPEFFDPYFSDQGFAVGMIANFYGLEMIPAGSNLSVLNVTLDVNILGENELNFCNDSTIAGIEVENVVVFDGNAVAPTALNGITISTSTSPAVGAPFTRGDCNVDNAYDIGDAVFLLDTLFGSTLMTCRKACDVNDDGLNDIADAIFALSNLFAGDSSPASPYPDCGNDLTDDFLDCEEPACS